MNEIRLIDANALKDRLKEVLKTEPSSLYGCGLRLAIEIIDHFPTTESKRPYVIDNCDMNVFEPEKYMKGGAYGKE